MATDLPLKTFPSGFKGSAQGLGCMSLTAGFYGDTAQEETSIKVLHKALDLGVTVFNTADLYGPYVNQELIGRAFKGVPRDKYVIASKWGPMIKDGKAVLDLSRKACRAALDDSLRRLQVDYIDLFILRGHGRDPNTPLEETMAEMKAAVDEGKVRYLGVSELSPSDIERAHAVHAITAVEMEWSLFSRDAERELVPLCRRLGIGFLAYSPLGRGMLTGKLDLTTLAANDFRRRAPRFQAGAIEQNLVLVERVKELAAAKGCTAGQLALAWVQARGPDVIPIPGTKSVERLAENVAAAHLRLTDEDVAALEAAVPAASVAGERYFDKSVTYEYE